ncbi:MAG: hypothetical protein QOG37_2560, partial [Mycobacterium sp.]|nr:hypothetical protein [Mycobacterium sp.]
MTQDMAEGFLQDEAQTEALAAPVTIGVEAYISQDYARAERD